VLNAELAIVVRVLNHGDQRHRKGEKPGGRQRTVGTVRIGASRSILPRN
jgi:hypothetical protein